MEYLTEVGLQRALARRFEPIEPAQCRNHGVLDEIRRLLPVAGIGRQPAVRPPSQRWKTPFQ
jgi:hypothetical protein